eukprot:6175081-Pleurochrysis_carterae.AAC.3
MGSAASPFMSGCVAPVEVDCSRRRVPRSMLADRCRVDYCKIPIAPSFNDDRETTTTVAGTCVDETLNYYENLELKFTD